MSLSVQTRILVTHGVCFLPYVDEIVVLVNGTVSEIGSYNSLRASKGAFSEFLDTYAKEQSDQTLSKSGNCTFLFLCYGVQFLSFEPQQKMVVVVFLYSIQTGFI